MSKLDVYCSSCANKNGLSRAEPMFLEPGTCAICGKVSYVTTPNNLKLTEGFLFNKVCRNITREIEEAWNAHLLSLAC